MTSNIVPEGRHDLDPQFDTLPELCREVRDLTVYARELQNPVLIAATDALDARCRRAYEAEDNDGRIAPFMVEATLLVKHLAPLFNGAWDALGPEGI